MKKLIMIMLTAFTLSAATAQINRKAWLIGASSDAGFNSFKRDGASETTVFEISTKAGYFVVNNLALGLNLGFASASTSGSTSEGTLVGFFARYYLPKNFFLGAGINAVSSSYGGSFSGSSSSTAFPFELGYAAFITKNIAIEPSINFVKGDKKGGVTYHGQDTGASSSIGLNIGFTVYLNRD